MFFRNSSVIGWVGPDPQPHHLTTRELPGFGGWWDVPQDGAWNWVDVSICPIPNFIELRRFSWSQGNKNVGASKLLKGVHGGAVRCYSVKLMVSHEETLLTGTWDSWSWLLQIMKKSEKDGGKAFGMLTVHSARKDSLWFFQEDAHLLLHWKQLSKGAVQVEMQKLRFFCSKKSSNKLNKPFLNANRITLNPLKRLRFTNFMRHFPTCYKLMMKNNSTQAAAAQSSAGFLQCCRRG